MINENLNNEMAGEAESLSFVIWASQLIRHSQIVRLAWSRRDTVTELSLRKRAWQSLVLHA